MKANRFRFRAWDADNKVMANHEDGIGAMWAVNMLGAPSDKYTVMQSTGLEDKNGVEIFEGDVLHYSSWLTDDGNAPYSKSDGWRIGDVYYHLGRFVVRGSELWNTFHYPHYEVIGNIHANPELMESK